MEQRWLIYGVKSRNNEGVTIIVLQWRWLLVVLMTVSSFLIGGLSPLVQAQSALTVALAANPTLGQILTASSGMTLYLFSNNVLCYIRRRLCG